MESITTAQTKLNQEDLFSIFRTSKRTIENYVNEIERHNRYRTARADAAAGTVMDNRAALIDLYESCIQQDAHLAGVIETLISQVLGERYMLASQTTSGKYIKDAKETKKIQGTQFVKIIRGILESRLYGYTLIEIPKRVNPVTGRLAEVTLIERRNVLPSQKYVVKRQGMYAPGWNITDPVYSDEYILVDNGDLGMFSATTPVVLAKKFTLANYISFAQTYGQPIIQGKSADDDPVTKQNMANDIAQSSAQRIIVTGLQDEITIHALAMSNSERIYTGVIDLADSAVSNLVLGSESMAGGTQSYVGSTNAHQSIFRDRIEVYREHIENVMNEEIIPRLVKRGFIPDGLEFKYANKLEMNNQDRIDLYDFLTDKYEISASEIEKEFGVVVERQINADASPVVKKKTEVVNFLSGKRE